MADAAPAAPAAPVPAAPAPAAPAPMMALARLAELALRLGTPGPGKLYTAARRRGIRVTKDQVRRFVATKGEKQLFRPLPPSKGRTATETPQMRWQMDLVDMRNSPSEGYKYILILINVFTRKVYAVPLLNKNPDQVTNALDGILNLLGGRRNMMPVIISSDAGAEFTGAVRELLDARNVVHRVKTAGDPNALAVVDRAIQNIKTRLAESLSKTPGDWYTRLRQVVDQYNATPHETLHDEPPDEVMQQNRETLRFMLHQDNAKKLKHNQQLLEGRKRQLEQAGAFRRPRETRNTFKRGFHATYGPMEQLDRVTGSLVRPTGNGQPIDIKRVLAVDRDTQDAQPGFALGEARTESRRQKVNELALELYDWMRDREVTTRSAVQHLKRALGDQEYERLLRSVGARSLIEVLRLFDDLELTETAGVTYVRRT